MTKKLKFIGWTIVRLVLPFLAAAGSAQAAVEEPPIIIATPYAGTNSSAQDFRFVFGAKAYVERINAAGGLQGRRIELMSLDDQGNPERLAANLREMVQKHKAVAFLGCLGDRNCEVTAAVASELKVPLIGALSGDSTLSRQVRPYVFRVRADYPKEVDAIVLQMEQMGHTKVAMLTDESNSPELATLLKKAVAARNMHLDVIKVQRDHLAEAVKSLGGGYHAVVMNISASTVDALVNQNLPDAPEWPRVLMTTATGNLAPMFSRFKGRTIGFSMVVPNPELQVMPLARELAQDTERYSSGHAMTLDGMEAYISARLLIRAIQQAGPRNVTAASLFKVLDTADNWDLGGFSVSFKKGRATGSDWVQMGLRSRNGILVN